MGPDPRDRPPERPVRARGDPLRDDRRPTSVPGGHSTRDAGAGPEPGAGPAHEAPAQDADGPRNDLPQGPPEGPRQALPRRRGNGRGPPPLPRRRADLRPPRRRPGTPLAVVQAQPPRRRPGRGGRADGDHDHGRVGGVRRVPEATQRRTRRVLQEGGTRRRRTPSTASRWQSLAKNDAIDARNAEADALKKERQAREKAEALVEGAFAQNRNALEAQRVLSVLLNQRLLSIPGTQDIREELISTTTDRPRGHDRLPGAARHGGPRQAKGSPWPAGRWRGSTSEPA